MTFKKHCLKNQSDLYIDGGIDVNNPGILALRTAMKLYPNRHYLMVILDTGNILNTIHWRTSHKWGALNWLPKAFALLLTTQQQQADASLQFIKSLLPPGTVDIKRINIKVTEPESKFNPSQRNIELLRKLADIYIRTHQKSLSDLANRLASETPN